MENCEFCRTTLNPREPANLALLYHLGISPDCKEQFSFAVENTSASWTLAMSGGA